MIGVSLAYGLGVGQVALLGAVILCYPPVEVQAYMYTPCVVNGSLSRACGRVANSRWDVAPAWGLTSVAVAWYVIATFRKVDGGELQGDFGAEEAAGDGEQWHWDAHFWVAAACVHWATVFMACSPVHLYTGATAGALMAYGLRRACHSWSGPNSTRGGGFGGLLVYVAGAAMACHSIPALYPNRYVLIGAQLALDCLLGMGHVWDRVTTMETVANCRVSYASWCALLLAGAYKAWWGSLAMPTGLYMDSGE